MIGGMRRLFHGVDGDRVFRLIASDAAFRLQQCSFLHK